ncbi:MAG: CBS domain-containing protein [Labilithrix sp.]|nr:CBS domain-containing protein [Labilithrix sp.]
MATNRARTTKTSPRRPVTITMQDVMTPQPLTIGRDQTLATAHKMMRDHDVRHLPVLERGRLVGLLSQRDLYFLETIAGVDLEKDTVDDAMSVDAFAVAPGALVAEVAATMATRKLGCAVVIERQRVVGVFTVTDACRMVAEICAAKAAVRRAS